MDARQHDRCGAQAVVMAFVWLLVVTGCSRAARTADCREFGQGRVACTDEQLSVLALVVATNGQFVEAVNHQVWLHCILTEKGTVQECRRTLGRPETEGGIIGYVEKQRYKLAMSDGGPARASLTVMVTVSDSRSFGPEVAAAEGTIFGLLARRAVEAHRVVPPGAQGPSGSADLKLCFAIQGVGVLVPDLLTVAAMGPGLPTHASYEECVQEGGSPTGRYAFVVIQEVLWTRRDFAVATGSYSVNMGGVHYSLELRRGNEGWTARETEAQDFLE